jgi:hypothetical protein
MFHFHATTDNVWDAGGTRPYQRTNAGRDAPDFAKASAVAEAVADKMTDEARPYQPMMNQPSFVPESQNLVCVGLASKRRKFVAEQVHPAVLQQDCSSEQQAFHCWNQSWKVSFLSFRAAPIAA